MATRVVAKHLIDRAAMGEVLEAEDRRICVGYLMATEPDISQAEMARRFQVTDTTIRNDIKTIKMASADMVRKDFIDLIAGDVIAEFERLSTELERSRRKAQIGTANYRQHIEAQMRMRLQVVESLQKIGVLPTNLGEVTVKKHVYKSEVQERTGQVVTRPLDLFDDVPEGNTIDVATPLLPESTGTEDGGEENQLGIETAEGA